MIIYFLTKQLPICKKLAEKLEIIDAKCVLFTKPSQLTELILSELETPDLLVIDYLSFPHQFFSVYDYMKSLNKFFPLIYYNDPFAPSENRADYWSTQVLVSGYKDDILRFRKYFLVLQEAVSNPAIAPYISLLQPPLPYSDSSANETISSKQKIEMAESKVIPQINIYAIKKKYGIPLGIFNLFSYLFENIENGVSVKELKNIYNPNKESVSENSIKIALTRLKGYLSKISEINMDLIYTGNGYKLVKI